MNMLSALVIILGLSLFETISSIDNAIINAEVISKVSKRARQWFLTWGLLVAVLLVRGLLPWLIVWATTPRLGPWQALLSTLSSDPTVVDAIKSSAPLLLLGGSVFLVLLFLHWLFLEDKNYGLPHEKYFLEQGIWFYAIASLFLTVLVWYSLKINPPLALSAVIGSTAFFITHGFKQQAEVAEGKLAKSRQSDLSKLLYLEVIDATFSIDGVLGAFAFTLSVPLILIGNGLGALVVRQLTIGNIKNIKKYKYLKNGAMYSILVLGLIMLANAFGVHIPELASPLATFLIVGYFFWISR